MPDLLGKLLGSEARRRGLMEARLLTDWATVIGEAIATRCQPVSLNRDGILHLDVTGGAALELQHAELQVIERINTYFGRQAVTRLASPPIPAQAAKTDAPRPPASRSSIRQKRPLSTRWSRGSATRHSAKHSPPLARHSAERRKHPVAEAPALPSVPLHHASPMSRGS